METGNQVFVKKIVSNTICNCACEIACEASVLSHQQGKTIMEGGIAIGSDDGQVRLLDTRNNTVTGTITVPGNIPVTSVFSTGLGTLLIGTLANDILEYDLRNLDVALRAYMGHSNAVSGISGGHILGHALDTTVPCLTASLGRDGKMRLWDNRRYVSERVNALGRCLAVSQEPIHPSPEMHLQRCDVVVDHSLPGSDIAPGCLMAAGGADHVVRVFSGKGELQYSLCGHEGLVTDVKFHPRFCAGERVIASCASDGSVLLGELGQVKHS
ncbi:hypothetical protein KIPB_009917 [Kipferlia bialata]|uniref:Uncharacterized protein n=1 Tax=Kipferlia bialata TaxID=797122 RepID=A0A9K3D2H9_9EUKA|nr:hypothetical protein KIPB_009917 [Kipferlia bialata]|eukprot:g9917.t1